MFKNTKFWIFLVQAPIAWEWFKASWDKVMEGGFGAEFARSLDKILGFSSIRKHPQE
jgi:hypothetical protein